MNGEPREDPEVLVGETAAAALAADAPPSPGPSPHEPTSADEPGPAALAPRAVAAAGDDLAAADLLALLAAVFPPGTRAAHWSACLDTIGPLAAGSPTELAGWTEGRVWGARAEVRWQRAPGGAYQALYLGDAASAPASLTPLADDLRAVVDAAAPALLFWGTRDADGRYQATRLPSPLDYPAAAALGLANEENGTASVPCELLVSPNGVVRWVRLALREEA